MLLLFFAACLQTPDSGKQDTGPDVRRDSADTDQVDTGETGDTGDSGKDTVETGGETGETGVDSGDTATDTGDSGKDTGDSGKDSGDTGKDTADTGDTGKDSGDTGKDTGDTGKDSGDTGKDTGDTGKDTGDTASDTATETGWVDTGAVDTGAGDARLGMAYAITLSGGTITEPAAAATLLEGEYDRGAMLFEVQAIADTTFTLLGAWSTSGSRPPAQDTSLSTWWWTADFSADPTFTTAPTDCFIGLGGIDEDWYEVELSGELPADGGDLADATLTGLLDTHNLDDLYGGDGAVCSLISAFGVSCEACPDGRDRCVRLTIEGLTGAAQASLDLVEVP